MARRAPLIKRTIKKTKKTRADTSLLDWKMMGDEPTFSLMDARPDQKKFGHCLNWYSYMCGKGEARDFLEEFFTNRNRTDDLKKLKAVPDSYMLTLPAWLCRMLDRGADLDQDVLDRMETKLRAGLDRTYKVEEDEEVAKLKPNIRDRVNEKVQDFIGSIESMIDSGEPFSLYDHMKSLNLPALYGKKAAAYYEPIAAELKLALTDKNVAEGYKRFSKPELRDRAALFQKLVEDGLLYGDNTKKLRVPRKKKAVPADKKLKRFKYQKEDAGKKLVSVDPIKIIGAQELWVVNTKYALLSVLRAAGTSGLDVKGTTIIGYDPVTSGTKRIGRKFDFYVDKVLHAGKIELRKLMSTIKGDFAPQIKDRIGESSILLKVTT